MRVITFFLIAIVGFCIVFFVGAFSNANIDITTWGFESRLAVAFFGAIVGVCFGVLGVAMREYLDD